MPGFGAICSLGTADSYVILVTISELLGRFCTSPFYANSAAPFGLETCIWRRPILTDDR